ncbi:MAG: hypothetical protein ACRC7N_21290 [Clostridium sp.]
MKLWSYEDVSFLEDSWSSKSITCIAKSLNRSVCSVKNKAQQLGLGRHLHQQEYITVAQLITALGLKSSYSWMVIKFEKYNLRIIKRASINKRYKVVYLDDFWKWAEENKGILNFAKFEKGNLGKEPKWVAEKRAIDLKNPSKVNHNRRWTKYDDSLLIEKTKSNRYTYKDLAKEFNRTESAIKRRLLDLKVPYRPIPLNNHIKWSSDENDKMVTLYNKGFDTNAIAQILNKTQLSICDRLRVRGLT